MYHSPFLPINSAADALSCVSGLVDDDVSSTHLADYAYLGLSTFVEVDYTEPDVKYTLVDVWHWLSERRARARHVEPLTASGASVRDGSNTGRVKDSYWYDYGSATDTDRIKYGYDRSGSRLWRENTVAAGSGKSMDELYGYDLIDRLKSMDRGDLNALKDAISNTQFAQDWSLDATGNWRSFREDTDGDSSWDLAQNRTSNTVNEITDITESAGPAWVTPVYNRAGNMTTIPKPADPTASFAATYDGWNRPVRIEEGADKVAEYEYDGAKRRTIKKTYSGGVLDETRHFYYTEPSKWQVIEERVDASSDPQR